MSESGQGNRSNRFVRTDSPPSAVKPAEMISEKGGQEHSCGRKTGFDSGSESFAPRYF